MVSFEQMMSALASPIYLIWASIYENFLGILGATLVILVGYLIGAAVGFVISFLLDRSKIDDHLEKAHVHSALGFIKIHNFIGTLVKWYIFSLFLAASTDLLYSATLASLVATFAFWLPKFLFGIIIFALGLILAEFVYSHSLHFKSRALRLLGEVIKVVIILVIALTALEQMDIDVSLASGIVMLLVGGIMLAVAIAFGIGFGLALKDDAKDIIKSWRKGKDF